MVLTPFVGYTTDLIGDTTTNTITIQAWSSTNVITGVSTNLVLSFTKSYYPTNPAGFFSGSLAPGNYKLNVEGIDRGIVFGIPSSSSTQNLAQLAGVPVYAFQNFTLAQFSDAGTAAYSNTSAFLLSSRTNWAVGDITNAGSAAFMSSNNWILHSDTNWPLARITNAGSSAYHSSNNWILHSDTNWPLARITNAGTMGHSNASTFVNFMLTNQAGAIWYGTIFSTNFNGNVGQLTNGTLWSSILVSPTLTNGVNYGSAFSSPGIGNDSEQFGQTATASGYGSLAVGLASSAGAHLATAVGADANASGTNSLALGQASEATAVNATALGSTASASYINSTALGYGATTTRSNQVVLGSGTIDVEVTGNFSVLGNQSNLTAVGTSSFADLELRRTGITTLANGINDDIIIGTNSNIYVSGPTADFSIRGLTGNPNRNGHLVFIEYDGAYNLTVAVEGGAIGNGPTAANRITSNTGADRVSTGACSAVFKYNAITSRWKLISFDP